MIPLGILASSIRTALPSEGDPHWDNVVALLHFDEVDGSQTFIDEKGGDVTFSGSPAISTSQSKFGGSSVYFAQGANAKLTLTEPSPDALFLDGDFTMEFFVYAEVNSSCLFRQETSNVYFYNNAVRGGGVDVPFGGWTLGEWVHYAWVRGGSTIRVFKNGMMTGQKESSAPIDLDGLRFGDYNNNLWYVGYLDELRITKGVARYTEDFTPPTGPFPNQ